MLSLHEKFSNLSDDVKTRDERRKTEESMHIADIERIAVETLKHMVETAKLKMTEEQHLLELRMKRQMEKAEEKTRAEELRMKL